MAALSFGLFRWSPFQYLNSISLLLNWTHSSVLTADHVFPLGSVFFFKTHLSICLWWYAVFELSRARIINVVEAQRPCWDIVPGANISLESQAVLSQLWWDCWVTLGCIGFTWESFGSRGAGEVASVQRSGGGVSVTAYLRKGKKQCTAAVRQGSKKNARETTLQAPRSAKKEGEKMLHAPEQRFPCSF